MRGSVLMLLLAMVWTRLCGGDATAPWSGTIALVERIAGPGGGSAAERTELTEYHQILKDRIRRAREELPTRPRVLQRLLKEDLAVFQSELERIATALGEEIPVSETRFILRGATLVVSGDGPAIQIDRAAGTARWLGAKLEDPILAPQPAKAELPAKAGPVWRGFQTRAMTLRIEGRDFQILIVPDLPNPFALGLLVGADPEYAALATVPGLPARVEWQSGQATRIWEARIEPAAPR